MIITLLADSTSSALLAGRVIGVLLVPAVGLILLILGLRSRSATRTGWTPGYYPPYPAAPGYPPVSTGYPGYPPPPPPRRSGTGLIVTGVVLLALGGVAILGNVAAVVATQPARVSVGDCFTNEILDGSRWKSVRCSDPDAVLEYAAAADSNGNCPDGKSSNSAYLSIERDGVRRCFAPNLLESRCYKPERDDQTIRLVDCVSAGKVIRVVKRIDGTTDTSGCPAESHGVTFPQPKRTYCTARVAETI